jgi:hypothetical protein
MYPTRIVPAFTNWLNAPVPGIPVDLCRIVTGAVSLAYFARHFVEANDFSAGAGLIDHALSSEIFPFTSIGLFNSAIGLGGFRAIFLLAALASVGLVLGYRPKLSAAIAYVVAVSSYRWNFLVMYVDDAIVHLLLFWMLLLPIGHTLTIGQWMTHRSKAWALWKAATLPGAAVRCFAGNVALIYLVAGLWKWTSPMWRDGTAVYAILKTPLAFASEWWGPEHLAFLIPLNYLALVSEPLFPLICVLRTRHTFRYVLLAALVGFHVFILATLRLPFANVMCLGAAAVLARDDLMSFINQGRVKPAPRLLSQSRSGGIFAVSFVSILTLAMLSSVTLPEWRTPDEPINGQASTTNEFQVEGLGRYQRLFFSALWAVGVAQQYQLLNWIDQRNFAFGYAVTGIAPDGSQQPIDANAMFPRNPRSLLLQAYLHGMVWHQLPPGKLSQFREGLKMRFAARYCRNFQPSGQIHVQAYFQRTGARQAVMHEPHTSFLMTFTCNSGKPVLAG